MMTGVDIRTADVLAVAVDEAGAISARASVATWADAAEAAIAAVERVTPASSGPSPLGIAMANLDSPVAARVLESLSSRTDGGSVGGGSSTAPDVWPELGSTIKEETSTASKAAPEICENSCRASLSQRSSGTPDRYQLDPLSARIIPYFFSALRITRTSGEKGEMSKLDLSRKR